MPTPLTVGSIQESTVELGSSTAAPPAADPGFVFHVDHPVYGTLHYEPTPKQREFHESNAPNTLLEGTRGTGKSVAIRMDAHMRAMAIPGFVYLVVRRTMPELQKTHLKFIRREMQQLGGYFNKSEKIAYYPNGSLGFFGHCETEDDMEKLLGGEYYAIYFDEMTTFTPEQIVKISTCARVPDGSGLLARVRGGTNPIGVGAEHVLHYYILKDVDLAEDPDYDPADYHAIKTLLSDNPHIDAKQYRKKFGALPEHIRRAWLAGEWVVEGMYFADFQPARRLDADDVIVQMGRADVDDVIEWHVISKMPPIQSWMHIYRAQDWGWYPDPAVTLWIVMLPNGRAIVFSEKHWNKTAARKVAQEVKERSTGMRVVDTYADPTMFANDEATELASIGSIFEANGVPLTESRNDRRQAGFAIHEWLNTILDDGLPKLQIFSSGAPQLIKTLPLMRCDKKDASKIGDGNDHWVISLGYFCQGSIGKTREPQEKSELPFWMRPKKTTKFVLGRESTKSTMTVH